MIRELLAILALLGEFTPTVVLGKTFFDILVERFGEENTKFYIDAFTKLTGTDHMGWLSRSFESFESTFHLNIDIFSWAMMSRIRGSCDPFPYSEIQRTVRNPFNIAYDIFLNADRLACAIPVGSTDDQGQVYYGSPGNFFATVCFSCIGSKDRRQKGCKHVRAGWFQEELETIYLHLPNIMARLLFQRFSHQYAMLLLSNVTKHNCFLFDVINANIFMRQQQLLKGHFKVFPKWEMPILPEKFLNLSE